jgi:hypothetical protein
MSDHPGYVGTAPDQADYTVAGVLAGKAPVRQLHTRDGYENELPPSEPQPMPCPTASEPLRQRQTDNPAVSDPQVPPRTGKGSSADAWALYAAAKNVSVELDAKRDDIIAACEQAGVPTE